MRGDADPQRGRERLEAHRGVEGDRLAVDPGLGCQVGLVTNAAPYTPRPNRGDWSIAGLAAAVGELDKARAALIRAQCQLEYHTPTSKEGRRLTRAAMSAN